MNAPFDDERLNHALRETLAARAALPGEHPDPEALLDYHLRALPEEDEERVADHLARCAECAQLVLDYDRLASPVPPEEAPTPAEREAAWARFEERRSLAQIGSRRGRWVQPLALAASLLLSVGLFFWGYAAHQRLRQPEARIALHHLEEVRTKRAGAATDQLELSPGIEKVWVTLRLTPKVAAPKYRVELRTADGRHLWSQSDAPRIKGSFYVEIPTRSLRPGSSYLFRIYDGTCTGAEACPLADFRFDVADSPVRR